MSHHRSKPAAHATPAQSHSISSYAWTGKWYNARAGNLSLHGTRLKFETDKRVVLDVDLSEMEELRWSSYWNGAAFQIKVAGQEHFFCFMPRIASVAQTREARYNTTQWRAALTARTPKEKNLAAGPRPLGSIIYDMVIQFMLLLTACCIAPLPLLVFASRAPTWGSVALVAVPVLGALAYALRALWNIWRLLREAIAGRSAA